ncbi:hypothetical protein EDB92DRAFT_1788137 [Lactarius akahatsu]|uniref:Uncharacterized protein n=1 Tax=Lactarius akahatsu TaxID=416441 RepID=A0AAD4LSH7_9AGAM|nr:hypothetical protein EDB92DRAFT_1788137 [Lactarius akahatsu]
MLSDRNAELINLLYETKWPGLAGESHAIDFTVGLFRQLGYMKHSRIAHTQKRIPFLIFTEWRDAKTDICLLNYPKHDILLLVLEEKHESEGPWVDATAQLIAGAIAAFDHNNRLQHSRGENIESKVLRSDSSVRTTGSWGSDYPSISQGQSSQSALSAVLSHVLAIGLDSYLG